MIKDTLKARIEMKFRKKQFEDNTKTNAFNMLLGCKSYLGLLQNFKLPEGGRNACMLHSASDDITLGDLRGNSSDEP